MPTLFTVTFDSSYGSLVLAAGERIATDIKEIRVQRHVDGGEYVCEIVRVSDGKSTRLVATSTKEGKTALAKAKGAESTALPGFVEAPPTKKAEVATAAEKAQSAVVDDIAKFFGCDA